MSMFKVAFLILMNSILVEFGLIDENKIAEQAINSLKQYQTKIDKEQERYLRLISSQQNELNTFHLFTPVSPEADSLSRKDESVYYTKRDNI